MNHKLFIKVIIVGLIIMANTSWLFAYDPQRSYFFEDWRTYNLDDPDDPLNSDWYYDLTTPWCDVYGMPWYSIPRWGVLKTDPDGTVWGDTVFVDDDRTCMIREKDDNDNPVINAIGHGADIYILQIILGYFNVGGEPGEGGGTLYLHPGNYTVRLMGELNAQEHINNIWQYGGNLMGQIRIGSKQPEYGGAFVHDNADAKYDMYGGTLTTTCNREANAGLVVGNSSPGVDLRCDAEFNMYGGSIITNQLALANQDCNGVFNMNGGTITFEDFVTATNPTDLIIGFDRLAKEATFNLGDVNTTGTLDGPYTNITVRSNLGIFNGWGTVAFGGTLSNSGIIDANGYGIERDLDFSSMSSVQEPNDNAVGSANGWYAENKGRLVLPSILVASGTNICNWGEAAEDTDIDMINSARITFDSSMAGTLTGNLLCDGRSDLPVNSFRVIGAWDFQNTASVSNVGIVVRYDDLLSAQLEMTEADLKIYQYQTDQWVDVTSSIDTTKKQISGSASSLGIFVVGVVITNPANCYEVHKIGQGYLGDLNYDCEVNSEDLSMFVDQWLMSGTLDSDFNHSSTVDALDFNILAEDWLQNNNP
ncbi:MAG: hypothetical protein A2Y10_04350 [Planctomycetes bacterium GWF2_41_51]|nr:MAG: hypothetical protein A2Y10_04350 [Planctomycetes bacterium GWF2_41_51]HBG27801.1 hypothetical protein [Phycisphaerales bacterium]